MLVCSFKNPLLFPLRWRSNSLARSSRCLATDPILCHWSHGSLSSYPNLKLSHTALQTDSQNGTAFSTATFCYPEITILSCWKDAHSDVQNPRDGLTMKEQWTRLGVDRKLSHSEPTLLSINFPETSHWTATHKKKNPKKLMEAKRPVYLSPKWIWRRERMEIENGAGTGVNRWKVGGGWGIHAGPCQAHPKGQCLHSVPF